MSDYLASDFTDPESGMDYIFGKMGAIYGAAFIRNFDGVDLGLVRATWLEMLGVYATYKPTLDFALNSMDKSFIPSAIAFRDLCRQAGRIPVKPEATITHQKTQEQIKNDALAKEKALKDVKKFHKGFGKC